MFFLGGVLHTQNERSRLYRQTLAQLYRDTIWKIRLDATYNNRPVTKETLEDSFIGRVKNYMDKHYTITAITELELDLLKV